LRFLLLNQCFYPDVVSTAQHLTDLARELTARGHQVTVLASDRGYDDPRNRFPRHEVWNKIEIIRIPSLSLGKASKLKRVINFGSFLFNCAGRLLTMRRFDVVVALTSPPLISLLASLFVAIKGGRFCFWVMDLNPDEAIAAGWLKDNSLTASVLKRMLNFSLRRADRTIVLDRFMEKRVLEKGTNPDRVSVLPPWSHDDAVSYSPGGRSAFREKHGLSEKFVVMYSGNHSPCHPLDSLLGAALVLESDDQFAFCFVGGGSEQNRVREFAEQHELRNITCLPYQPIEELAGSLSAADLHVVVMGEKFVGIVHPCKVYNILSIRVPLLYIGPNPSHITDIAQTQGQITCVPHSEINQVVQEIRRIADHTVSSPSSTANYLKKALLPRMVALIEFSNCLTPAAESTHQTNASNDTQAQEVVL
jgi:putative colanic acid biosynthesis glycosyltransferase WcaI